MTLKTIQRIDIFVGCAAIVVVTLQSDGWYKTLTNGVAVFLAILSAMYVGYLQGKSARTP